MFKDFDSDSNTSTVTFKTKINWHLELDWISSARNTFRVARIPKIRTDPDPFWKMFTDPDPQRNRPISKNVMGPHKIQIFSRTDIAIAFKLLNFGNLFGCKINSPKSNQIFFDFFVILRTKSKKFRDFHKNHTDPENGSGSCWLKKHGSAPGSEQPWIPSNMDKSFIFCNV